MSLPPSGYPKIRGQACGADWAKPTLVTGLLPGTGFGSKFKHTVEPLATNYGIVKGIGDDRDEQNVLRGKIIAKIADVRERIDAFVPEDVSLTNKERQSLEWLLDHAEAEIEAADAIWESWSTRATGKWPLNLGDDISSYGGGVCKPSDMGQWIRVTGGGRKYNVQCPSITEILRRSKDRAAIGQRFSDALAHVYCAEFGYWRLSLYKYAAREYASFPSSGIGGFTIPGGPGPGPSGPGGKAGTPLPPLPPLPPIDLCKDLGIGCPSGEGPIDCPSGFCPDPDDLPDPADIPEAEGEGGPLVPDPGPSTPGMKRVVAPYLIVSGLGALLITSVAYSAIR